MTMEPQGDDRGQERVQEQRGEIRMRGGEEDDHEEDQPTKRLRTEMIEIFFFSLALRAAAPVWQAGEKETEMRT